MIASQSYTVQRHQCTTPSVPFVEKYLSATKKARYIDGGPAIKVAGMETAGRPKSDVLESAALGNAGRTTAKRGTRKRGTKTTSQLKNARMSTMESQNALIYIATAYVCKCSLSLSSVLLSVFVSPKAAYLSNL